MARPRARSSQWPSRAPQHAVCVPDDSQFPTEQGPIEPVLARRSRKVDHDVQCIDGQVGPKMDDEARVVIKPPHGCPHGSSHDLLYAYWRLRLVHGGFVGQLHEDLAPCFLA